jgi:hypothetical protein
MVNIVLDKVPNFLDVFFTIHIHPHFDKFKNITTWKNLNIW